MLTDNGTRVLKFMLHISKEEQKNRLFQHIEDPEKALEIQSQPISTDRKLWDVSGSLRNHLLARCSTKVAPWHVIPADRNWPRNALIARIVRATLEEMEPALSGALGLGPEERGGRVVGE